MSDVNIVAVSGRTTRDPELRHTQNGTAVANFAVAVERYRKDEENDVSFIDVTVWAGFAELIAQKLRKGDPITVQGELNQQRWETDDGQKRSKVEIVARNVVGEFIYRKADGSDTPDREDGEQQTLEPVTAGQGDSDDDIPF